MPNTIQVDAGHRSALPVNVPRYPGELIQRMLVLEVCLRLLAQALFEITHTPLLAQQTDSLRTCRRRARSIFGLRLRRGRGIGRQQRGIVRAKRTACGESPPLLDSEIDTHQSHLRMTLLPYFAFPHIHPQTFFPNKDRPLTVPVLNDGAFVSGTSPHP